jgi:hypothetical protein
VLREIILIIKPTRYTKYIFGIKLYMFRTVPLSIIRRFSLYTKQRDVSYRFADSEQDQDGTAVLS